MNRPVSYFLLIVIAWVSIAGGVWLVVSGQGHRLSPAELKRAEHDAVLRMADEIIAGNRNAHVPEVSAYRPADPLRVTLGAQAIFAGIVLGGFASVIRLLDDIARAGGRGGSAQGEPATGRGQAQHGAPREPQITRNLSGRPVRKWSSPDPDVR